LQVAVLLAITLAGPLAFATNDKPGPAKSKPVPSKPESASELDKKRPRVTPIWTGDKALFGKVVTAIRHTGLDNTVKKVVTRELLFGVGARLQQDKLVETVRRLRNLRVFRTVGAELIADGPGVKIVMSYDEKWTLLPIFSLGRGGARTFVTAGLIDIHAFGRLLELSARYSYFAGTHSYALLFTDPRLFDKRFLFSVYGQIGERNRWLYDTVGDLEGLYSRHRKYLRAAVSDQRNPERVWSLSLDAVDDTFDETLLTDEERQVNTDRGFSAPPNRRSLLINGTGRLGRINLDDYIQHGRYAVAVITAGLPLFDEGDAWFKAKLSGKLALPLRWRQNIVLRVIASAATDAVPEFQNYIGGLYYVRGFFEGRFRGRMMWAASAEYRIPSLHHRLAVLQHVLFVDAGDAGNDLGHFARRPGISLGTGARLILPLVANFLARLDIAWFIEPQRDFDPSRDWRVSFGSQQYF